MPRKPKGAKKPSAQGTKVKKTSFTKRDVRSKQHKKTVVADPDTQYDEAISSETDIYSEGEEEKEVMPRVNALSNSAWSSLRGQRTYCEASMYAIHIPRMEWLYSFVISVSSHSKTKLVNDVNKFLSSKPIPKTLLTNDWNPALRKTLREGKYQEGAGNLPAARTRLIELGEQLTVETLLLCDELYKEFCLERVDPENNEKYILLNELDDIPYQSVLKIIVTVKESILKRETLRMEALTSILVTNTAHKNITITRFQFVVSYYRRDIMKKYSHLSPTSEDVILKVLETINIESFNSRDKIILRKSLNDIPIAEKIMDYINGIPVYELSFLQEDSLFEDSLVEYVSKQEVATNCKISICGKEVPQEQVLDPRSLVEYYADNFNPLITAIDNNLIPEQLLIELQSLITGKSYTKACSSKEILKQIERHNFSPVIKFLLYKLVEEFGVIPDEFQDSTISMYKEMADNPKKHSTDISEQRFLPPCLMRSLVISENHIPFFESSSAIIKSVLSSQITDKCARLTTENDTPAHVEEEKEEEEMQVDDCKKTLGEPSRSLQ